MVQIDINHPVGVVADRLAHSIETALLSSLVEMKAKGDSAIPHHLYVTIMAVSTAINIAAKLMAMPEDPSEAEEWSEGPVSRTAILAAALLLARCSKPVREGIEFEFNPRNILAALEAAEKITGHNNDSVFTPQMVTAARKQSPVDHFFDNSDSIGVIDLSKFRTLN